MSLTNAQKDIIQSHTSYMCGVSDQTNERELIENIKQIKNYLFNRNPLDPSGIETDPVQLLMRLGVFFDDPNRTDNSIVKNNTEHTSKGEIRKYIIEVIDEEISQIARENEWNLDYIKKESDWNKEDIINRIDTRAGNQNHLQTRRNHEAAGEYYRVNENELAPDTTQVAAPSTVPTSIYTRAMEDSNRILAHLNITGMPSFSHQIRESLAPNIRTDLYQQFINNNPRYRSVLDNNSLRNDININYRYQTNEAHNSGNTVSQTDQDSMNEQANIPQEVAENNSLRSTTGHHGIMKRHNFRRSKASHGPSINHRITDSLQYGSDLLSTAMSPVSNFSNMNIQNDNVQQIEARINIDSNPETQDRSYVNRLSADRSSANNRNNRNR